MARDPFKISVKDLAEFTQEERFEIIDRIAKLVNKNINQDPYYLRNNQEVSIIQNQLSLVQNEILSTKLDKILHNQQLILGKTDC